MPALEPFQRRYAQPAERLAGWSASNGFDLDTVVANARPTVLIGVSGHPGMFSEPTIRTMARNVDRPAILPLSNPTDRCEAMPADLLAWTGGKALVATGSPFDDVTHGGRRFPIAQCNNAYIFPGLGQGAIASGAGRVTDGMFLAAARTLAGFAPVVHSVEKVPRLLPPLDQIVAVSRRVAGAVAAQAMAEGLIPFHATEELDRRIDARWWRPRYRRLRPRC